MQCIARKGEDRCNNLVSNSSRFCVSCAFICIPFYMKYKKIEERIKEEPKNEAPEEMLKYYSRLKKAYNLRLMFRQNFIHPSEVDEGHEKRLDLLLKKKKDYLSRLRKVWTKERSEIIMEDSENEEDIQEPSPSPYCWNHLEKLPKKYSGNDEEIITPFDIVMSHTEDEDFTSFLLQVFYFLFNLFFSMIDEEEMYIRSTPLLRIKWPITVETRHDIFWIHKYLNDFNDLLPYAKDLYQEIKKRSFLIYRFYRVNRETYALTFIRNADPVVFYIYYKDTQYTIYVRNIPNKDYNNEACIETSTNNPRYTSYHDPFPKSLSLVVDGERLRSYSMYNFEIFDAENRKDLSAWSFCPCAIIKKGKVKKAIAELFKENMKRKIIAITLPENYMLESMRKS